MWDLTVPGNNDHDFYVLPDSRMAATSTRVEADSRPSWCIIAVVMHRQICRLRELAAKVRSIKLSATPEYQQVNHLTELSRMSIVEVTHSRDTFTS